MKRFIAVVSISGVLALAYWGGYEYLKYRARKETAEKTVFDPERYSRFVPEDARHGLNKKASQAEQRKQ